MRVYLIVSRKSRELGDEVASLLRKEGHEVFVPHEHPQLDEREEPKVIFQRNTKELQASDTVVALFGTYYGKDFTAEVGLSYGLWKYIVGVGEADKKDLMSYLAVSVWSTVEQLPRVIHGPLRTRSLGA